MWAVILTIGLGLFPFPGLAKQVHKAESRVEVGADGSAGRVTNRTFEVISHPETKQRLLLQKEIQETFQDDEPGGGRVRIDAWRLPRSPGSKPLYSISEPGAEIGWLFYPELLKVRIRACCDSSGSYTIFNAATGKMLVYADGAGDPAGRLATVTRNGTVMMLIGVLEERGGRRPSILPEHGHGFPVLVTTADHSSCRRQLLFNLPAPPNRMAVYLRSVTWERNKTGPRSDLQIELGDRDNLDAVLKVVVSDGRTILLPVSDAGVNAAKVVSPVGATMTEVSPCKL